MRRFFATGELVPKTGIYKVEHRAHRLMPEVALLQGQRFPRCSRCSNDVTYTFLPGKRPPAEWTVVIDTVPAL
jgi:hypothetical protein